MTDSPTSPEPPHPLPTTNYRAFLIPAVGLLLVIGGFLLFGNLNNNLVYYLTTTEARQTRADFPDGRRFRLAGEVVPGTIESLSIGTSFIASDGSTRVTVRHEGDPPQLFQEGIEVVVEGSWDGDAFVSDVMLVKHDEEYRVPEEGNYQEESP
ncbi:MAG: cytochrome c maturation protein CcmE [Acidimicrobiia bacterium]|nr:cytochrome c maturation protein CcmE [Acidimicrobiia bacterium]NNC41742.1 cytochrome c maturation protein CcmE [Acidimicrobiia bacterium]